MSSSLLVVTPPARFDARLAIAAVRCGEWGVVDLGQDCNHTRFHAALTELCAAAKERVSEGARGLWGVRIDIAESKSQLTGHLASLADFGKGSTEKGSAGKRSAGKNSTTAPLIPLLVLAGVSGSKKDLRESLKLARARAEQVLVEIYSPEAALLAAELGYDAVILKGNEAGGRVAPQSSYLLLQHLQNKLTIPYWVQGGIGPQTAAAAMLAGAAGVVLCEQLWLAEESPFTTQEQRAWRQFDGSETVCIGTGGGGGAQFRFSSRAARTRWQQLLDDFVTGAPWPQTAYAAMSPGTSQPAVEVTSPVKSKSAKAAPVLEVASAAAAGESEEQLLPMGQEIGLAGWLAKRYQRTGTILAAYRRAMEDCLKLAPEQKALLPESALAAVHGTRFPIAQGPMTRVSDVAPFCLAVAEAGALPFLALALLREGEVRRLLTDAKERLGSRPWGVGILGFVPPELRKEQMAAVLELPPTYAIVAGGRPSQARELEDAGISTYLHVPSPGLLQSFLKEGSRKFIFEGRECGGHVGPQSSFNLWQNAIHVLLEEPVTDPENVQLLFAGGIHDRFSASMVAALAAPLVARGMKIGVLMGTAYLFTEEIVSSGAINAEFQRQAIACGDTALLESGVGHATRCAITPFVSEFGDKKRELVEAGRSSDEIRHELEMFNIGRLRIASKGVERTASAPGETRAPLAVIDEVTQRQRGMYMIGEIAALHDTVVTATELHEEVTIGSNEELSMRANRVLEQLPTDRNATSPGEDLAIVGLGCMFPDSPDLRTYWQNIVRRFDAVREVPDDRWEADAYFDSNRMAKDRVYSKWGSFLTDVPFDPLKYGIPPATLSSIEPVQLLALEVASEALADAGIDRPGFPRQRTSVLFAAAGTHDLGMGYAFRTMMRHYLPQVEGLDDARRNAIMANLESHLPEWTEDSFAGFLMNVIAGRIANRFDLGGTNYTVDAACASSLAALQTAVEQLRAGTCDAALVGAVDGTNNPFCFMSFAKTHALSPRGRSRPFDESADGIALGEGVAAMVLKRLSDAERDGDKIYAVLKGIGSSSDGRNRSLTAPFPAGQLVALDRAYADAGVPAGSVTLLEAHATGTAVGDRVEISALQQMLRQGGAGPQACGVGSVKSMIGHTKTAAGLASLIKTTLALKHRLIPSTLGVTAPTEEFQKADSPLYVNADNRPWLDAESGTPRRAGVSAFGFGGTNFHVVLEEYGTHVADGGELDLNPRPAEVFHWTRARRKDIASAIQVLADQIQPELPLDLAQLAYSQLCDEQRRATKREGVLCRLAISATNLEDLRGKLTWAQNELGKAGECDDVSDPAAALAFERPDGVYYAEAEAASAESICFLFPGQGSQAVDMLKDLVLNNPWSFDALIAADAQLADRLPRRLSRAIFPPAAFTDEARSTQQQELNDTRVAQPALAVMELFYLDLLAQYGVQPGMVAGHSFGEYAALCAANVINRETLIHLAARRGAVMHAAAASQPGGMAAVFAGDKETLRALEALELDAVPANQNAPDQTVIAGPNEAIDEAVRRLPEMKLRAKRIPVSAAFHTPAMLGAAEAFAADLNAAKFSPACASVYSNVTAEAHPTDELAMRGLLIRHITEPVRFVDQIRAMYDRGARVFVECGPGNVLTGLVRRILGDRPHTSIAQASGGGSGALAFANGLARFCTLGVPVRLERAFAERGLQELGVSTYVESVRKRQERKPTDWLVNASRAVPVRGKKRPPATPVPQSFPETNTNCAATSPAPLASSSDLKHSSTNGNGHQNGAKSAGNGTMSRGTARGLLPSRMSAILPTSAENHDTPPVVPAPQATIAPSIAASVQSAAAPVSSINPTHRVHDGAMPMSQEVLPAMSQSPEYRPLASNAMPVADQSVFANLQSTLNQWLVLQQNQLQVSARFLETQERIAMACLQGGAVLPALGNSTTSVGRIAAPVNAVLASPVVAAQPVAMPAAPVAVAAAPAPVQAPAPAPRVAAPVSVAAVAPSPTVARNGSHGTNGASKHTNGHAETVAPVAAPAPVAVAPKAPVAAPAPAPVALAPTSGAKLPPPTEEFREALLQAVSERTGYPIEMLGEDRQLEADLGIDSIKTVEIFSSLNDFHVYLPGGDENQEESLAEFASMKTLRDIISVYDRRRAGTIAQSGAAAPVAAEAASGAKAKPVERFTLDATAAPLSDAEGKKKTSHSSTSY